MSYKTWGHFSAQTVRQDAKRKNIVIIREGERAIEVNKREIDSLITALLGMRK